jgi:hypothetical protein
MSFTLILAEVLDFFQPLKYRSNHNVFKMKVKRSFLILSKERALLFFGDRSIWKKPYSS